MPAPDGEEYFVTALFFASGRWGDGVGIYNYKSEATRLLSDLKNRAAISGQTVQGFITNLALFSAEKKMVRFTPDMANSEHTDPSYQLPAFYEYWSQCAPPADRAFWRQAAAAGRDFFQRAADPATGLCPEYANFDGTPWAAPWKPGSVDFRFDAWRVAMNWSVDWSWWHGDPRERILSDRLQAFFESQNISRYANQFTLSGKPLSPDHSPGLAAMNAVASLASTDPRGKKFVEVLWNLPVPSGFYRYYDGMLYLMALLHCSGEFKAWSPK
jgi:oligosaccharide reducing-end xylanase